MVYGVSESFACVPMQIWGWPHAPRITSALVFQGNLRTSIHGVPLPSPLSSVQSVSPITLVPPHPIQKTHEEGSLLLVARFWSLPSS